MSEPIHLRAASAKDLAQISDLLEENDLPSADIGKWIENFLIAVDLKGSLIGVAGVEVYDESCLLRSVVVDKHFRSRGHGRTLVEAALKTAKAKGVKTAYLLTDDASKYFERLGFVVVDRRDVDGRVKTSVEFTELCPESAIAMRKQVA